MAEEMRSVAARPRARYQYDVPAELQTGTETFRGALFESVGLVELTADEELNAAKKSRGDSFRLAYELAKQSLVEVNGETINRMSGEDEEAWNKMPAPLRSVVLEAFADIHSPKEELKRGFLASKRVKVA